MTYSTFLYATAIGLTYIASRHTFGHRIPYLHHIHDAVFSLSISHSASIDIDSWLASGTALTLVGGETRITVRMFELLLPVVYTVYAMYKLIWERDMLLVYEKLKYNVGLTLVTMYVFFGFRPWALAALIYVSHGHLHVVDALLKASQEAGTIQPFAYLRMRAILYMWVILPVCWLHNFVAILYNADWGVEFLCFLGLCGYILFETYIAVIDYGYNRALLRIQRRVDVEEIL